MDPFLVNFLSAAAVIVPATLMFFGLFTARLYGRRPVFIFAPCAALSMIIAIMWMATKWRLESTDHYVAAGAGILALWATAAFVGWFLAKAVAR